MNDDDATTVFDIPALEEPLDVGQRRGRHARTRRVPALPLRRPTGRHALFGAGAAVLFGVIVGLGYAVGEALEVPRPPGTAAAGPSTDPEPAVVEPTGRPVVRASASAVTAPRYPRRRLVVPSPRAAAPASPTPTSAAPSPSPSRPLLAPPRTPTPTPTTTVSTSPAAP